MARHWPPCPADLDDGRSICEELGLGPLLRECRAACFRWSERWAGSCRMVSAAGLFIARALLQEAEVVILDESLLRSIRKRFNARCFACSTGQDPGGHRPSLRRTALTFWYLTCPEVSREWHEE